MQTVLVMVPMRPTLHQDLKLTQHRLLAKMTLANPNLRIEIAVDERGNGDNNPLSLWQRVAHIAPIRQAMVEDYLKDHHDMVLWIDADINQYDSDLPTKLLEKGDGNVAAPLVLHNDPTWPKDFFYDTAGFIENGRWCNPRPPYFRQTGVRVELDSVGAFYMVPADVYRAGGKHEPSIAYTEHYSVCKKAKDMGYKVCVFRNLKVYHARLTDFGEIPHW